MLKKVVSVIVLVVVTMAMGMFIGDIITKRIDKDIQRALDKCVVIEVARDFEDEGWKVLGKSTEDKVIFVEDPEGSWWTVDIENENSYTCDRGVSLGVFMYLMENRR